MADPIAATGTPTARSLNYPVGGQPVVETKLGSYSSDRFVKADFSRWAEFGKLGLVGTVAGAVVGAAAGVLFFRGEHTAKAAATAGAIVGALVGGVSFGGWGAWNAEVRTGNVRDLAHEDASYATRFDVNGRPALPAASEVPTVEATTRVGKNVAGVTGSSVGSIVTFSQKYLEMTSMQVTTTVNSKGEPLISIGNVSGTSTSYNIAVDTVYNRHNTIGLGKVLYDTDGYDSLADAENAVDGKHSVAIVQQGNKYFIADFDAEDFSQIGNRNAGMIIGDSRVKAIYTNKNVYYPTNLSVGPATEGDLAPSTGKVFLFGHGQDIDKAVPATVASLDKQPIGMYDTNAAGSRDHTPDVFTLNVSGVLGGDEYSGPGWSNRAEAVGFMLTTPGNQALVRSGDRYYVTNTYRQSTQHPVTPNDPNRAITLDQIVDSSTTGSYIHGLRTIGAQQGIEVVEESGGLYVPVGDWWVRANLSE